MSILIKGMEMPKHDDEYVIFTVYGDGGVVYGPMNRPHVRYKNRAVPIPPHGDLIDLKAPFKAQYYDEMTEEWLEKTVTVEDALYGCMVDEMPPTIIAAEEGE